MAAFAANFFMAVSHGKKKLKSAKKAAYDRKGITGSLAGERLRANAKMCSPPLKKKEPLL